MSPAKASDPVGLFASGIGGLSVLQEIRALGEAKRPVLEVYHNCLLLGFEGQYKLSGREQLEAVLQEPAPTPNDVPKHTYSPSRVDAVYPDDYTGLPE